MAKKNIEIYNGETLESTVTSLSNYTIAAGYTVIVYSGTAAATAVADGGQLTVSGGTANQTTVKQGGRMSVNSGTVSDVSVKLGATLEVNDGTVSDVKVSASGIVVVNGGTVQNADPYYGSSITVNSGGTIADSRQSSGTITLNGGSASGITITGGAFILKSGSRADGVRQENPGSSMTIEGGAALTDFTCDGAQVTAAAGATVTNSKLTGYQMGGLEGSELLIVGTLTLQAGAVHRGTLFIQSGYGELIAETGSVIDFTLTAAAPGGQALINNFAGISGTPGYTITVGADQAAGTYQLAAQVTAFTETVTVTGTSGRVLGTLNTDTPLETPDYDFNLALSGTNLTLTVADSPQKPSELAGDEYGVSWESTAEQFIVQYTQDNFSTVLELQTAADHVAAYAMTAGGYAWRVKSAAGTRWSEAAEEITASYTAGGPRSFAAVSATAENLFFANAGSVWDSWAYTAKHVGSPAGWDGTAEEVALVGKNRFSDTFAGMGDANVLVLTDDANGDALFVDDVYTAFPDAPQARIAQISEIRAGAGDDVVDMTSQTFEYSGNGVVIRGGDGNDTIWANKGSNTLLGDAGADRLVGSAGNDVLAGGAGADSMHGGGGADIFCFCADWGSDEIEQLSGGSVILWFQDAVELTFTPSGGDTQITSEQGSILVKDMTLTGADCRFGAAGYEEEFARLSALGAFAAQSSTTIFAAET